MRKQARSGPAPRLFVFISDPSASVGIIELYASKGRKGDKPGPVIEPTWTYGSRNLVTALQLCHERAIAFSGILALGNPEHADVINRSWAQIMHDEAISSGFFVEVSINLYPY